MGLNPEKLRRIRRSYQRFEFEDPNQDVPLVLHLAKPTELERGYADDLRKSLGERYITGGFMDEQGRWQKSAEVLHDTNGSVMILSDSVIQFATLAFVMQDDDAPEEERYDDPLDLISLVNYYPEAWMRVKETVVELLGKPAEKKEPASTVTS